MARYKATAKGYYGDVIHDPDTDHHVYFDGQPGMKATWFEEIDGGEPEPEQPKTEVTEETLDAEAVLDAESTAAAPTVETTEKVVDGGEDQPTPDPDDDDIPGDTDLDDDTETL